MTTPAKNGKWKKYSVLIAFACLILTIIGLIGKMSWSASAKSQTLETTSKLAEDNKECIKVHDGRLTEVEKAVIQINTKQEAVIEKVDDLNKDFQDGIRELKREIRRQDDSGNPN